MSSIAENPKAGELKLTKILSPAAHGVVDYAHAAFFLGLGFLTWRSNRRAAWAALTTSGLLLTQSLTTDYRYGAKPLISFKTHGKMDAVVAATSWTIPLLFGFKNTVAGKVFEANSLAESFVVGATDWDSYRAHQERLEA